MFAFPENFPVSPLQLSSNVATYRDRAPHVNWTDPYQSLSTCGQVWLARTLSGGFHLRKNGLCHLKIKFSNIKFELLT